MVNNPPANARDARDVGSIPGLGRFPGEGHGHSSNPAWEIPWTEEPSGAIVHGVGESWTQLSTKSTTCLNHWRILSPNWPLGYE